MTKCAAPVRVYTRAWLRRSATRRIALGFDRIAMRLAALVAARRHSFSQETAARALFEGAPTAVPDRTSLTFISSD